MNESTLKEGTGCLYVVATPIGNCEDITLRALRILEQVDIIAAEDTRNTGALLARHQIKTPLISYQEHNEMQRTPELMERISTGQSIALVSDAGTPSISDPGYRLIRAATAKRERVVPIPGPSAAIAALSVSGMPTDTFMFIGFPARKKEKRLKQLNDHANSSSTLIFYESPHRILSFLKDAIGVMGDRYGVLSREMTKRYEEFIRGNLSEIHQILEQRAAIKGEFTLLVSGCSKESTLSAENLKKEIKLALKAEGSRVSQVAKNIAARSGHSKKTIYEMALKIKNDD
jgi:16S rRNA (cytidine1402-2'-O)-methyltransferase